MKLTRAQFLAERRKLYPDGTKIDLWNEVEAALKIAAKNKDIEYIKVISKFHDYIDSELMTEIIKETQNDEIALMMLNHIIMNVPGKGFMVGYLPVLRAISEAGLREAAKNSGELIGEEIRHPEVDVKALDVCKDAQCIGIFVAKGATYSNNSQEFKSLNTWWHETKCLMKAMKVGLELADEKDDETAKENCKEYFIDRLCPGVSVYSLIAFADYKYPDISKLLSSFIEEDCQLAGDSMSAGTL